MRTCTRCQNRKPLAEFYVRRGKPSTRCKRCERESMRIRYATSDEYRAKVRERAQADYIAVRQAAVRIYGGVCTTCGSADRLEFDHAGGDGEERRANEGHRQYLRRIAASGARLADVDLQLLCKPCHSAKSVAAGEHVRGPAGHFV